jgi:hypothetical protein
MSYVLLIVEPRGQRGARSLAEGKGAYQRMVDFSERLKSEGVLLATNSLRERAVRLNVEGGRKKVVDGPFTEAKEFIGGFFLLECDSQEQALEIAARCPAAEWATIEVRETAPCYE